VFNTMPFRMSGHLGLDPSGIVGCQGWEYITRRRFLLFQEVLQFETTPKAFTNSSPRLERKRQPWVSIQNTRYNPERVRRLANPYRVSIYLAYKPKVLAALEPWAEVSQRLRRIFKLEPNTLFQVGVLFPRLNQHGQI
jgi:hypothetical protein